jgi:hypothetical protein
VRGIAWDGGYGISRVDVSSDGGKIWHAASLGADGGRFAFRPWRSRFAAPRPGKYELRARASNRVGQTQADALIFNPAGYHNNVARPLTVVVT